MQNVGSSGIGTNTGSLAVKVLREADFLTYGLAGILAGTLTETILHPLTTVRTRIKANAKEFMTLKAQTKSLYQTEGLRSFYRGFSCTLFNGIFANWTHFYFYEKGKELLKREANMHHDMAPFFSAFVGGMLANIISIPCVVVRTRMQLEPGSYDYRNISDGFRKIVRREGFTKLYLGATIFLTLDAIDASFTFGFYELLLKIFRPYFNLKEQDKHLGLILASSLTSALSAVISNPLDVILTRTQMVDTSIHNKEKVFPLIRRIYREEGAMGFMKGLTGRIAHFAVYNMLLFPFYEHFKSVFELE